MGVEHNMIIVSWGYPVPGREALANEHFATRMAYFEKCKKAGRLESWEPVVMAPHGAGPAGFFILRGSHANLLWLSDDAEFQEQNMQALHYMTNFAVLNAFGGQAIPALMGIWAKAVPR